MSHHNEEQLSATVSDDLSPDSTIHDDPEPLCQFGPNDMYADAKNRRMFQWYQDVIATNNPDLNLDDYLRGCYDQGTSQQKETPKEELENLATRTIPQKLDTSEEELIDLDEATRPISQQKDTPKEDVVNLATRSILQQKDTLEEKLVNLATRTILQELDTSDEELIDLDEATRPIPQQDDTSDDGLIDLDEATRIIPHRVFPLVPADATVAQAFFVSGLEYISSDAASTYDNIAALIDSLESKLPSPLLTIHTHIVDKNAFPKTLSAKIASLWDFEDDTIDDIAPYCSCARCQHNPVNNPQGLTLLTCENCMSVEYCSVNCQDADWGVHQIMYCVNPDTIPPAQFREPRVPSFLRTALPNPFARLSKGIWLHDRHKIDVYALVIDSFRLREADDWWYGGLRKKGSIYNGKENSCSPFRLFLNQAETKGLMPPWWSKTKRVECLDMGLDQTFDNFHDLSTRTRDIEVLVIYESPMLLMQLRMFAESVLGTGPARTNGQLMLQKMVVVEEEARASAK